MVSMNAQILSHMIIKKKGDVSEHAYIYIYIIVIMGDVAHHSESDNLL